MGVVWQKVKAQFGWIVGNDVNLIRGEVQGEWWWTHVFQPQPTDESVIALDLPVHFWLVEFPDQAARWSCSIQLLDDFGRLSPESSVCLVSQHADQHVFGVCEVAGKSLFLCTLLLSRVIDWWGGS